MRVESDQRPWQVPVRGSLFNIHTSTLFDPKKKAFVKDVSIIIDPKSGTIADVYQREEVLGKAPEGDIDLRDKVVMPGLVDAHTHVFLHSYTETSSVEQMRDEGVVERIVRATNHVRTALLAGYTTYRDLGTEALQTADIGLRDSINRGLIPGPRLFVATHALAPTGGYEIRSENIMGGLRLPQASEVGDGPQGVRRAVRRRVGDGCDVIKFYAEYRSKPLRFPPGLLFPPPEPNPQTLLFSQEEMDMIVQEATMANLPVAAHVGTSKGALMAAKAGVTSIEHAFEGTPDAAFTEMQKNGIIWVPTLAVMEKYRPDLSDALARTKKAYDAGIRLAAGGDTGAFAHGQNARELELLVEAGLPTEAVLEACTIGGWESCGGDKSGFRFGWFERGNRADIIALDSDPRQNKHAFRKVSFVMKDGRVWKKDGVAIDMIDNDHDWDV